MRSYKCCSPDTLKQSSILAQSSLLKLIADPNRLKLLCILHSNTHCVCELIAHSDMSQSLISHHLADLRKAGIVSDEKIGRQVHYSLTTKGKQVLRLLSAISNKE